MQIDKPLPNCIESEQSIIARQLLFGDETPEALEMLTPEDFYSTKHQAIWDAILQIDADAMATDLTAVVTRLNQSGKLQHAGGAGYLAEIIDDAPVAINAEKYCSKVKDLAKIRRFLIESSEVQGKCFNPGADCNEILDDIQSRLLTIESDGTVNDSISLDRGLEISIDRYEEVAEKARLGVIDFPTGFADIDRMTCGLAPGSLNFIAGRPSMGKSSIAFNMAIRAAKRGYKIAIFTLEMSKEQLMNGLFAIESGINLLKFRRCNFDRSEWQAMNDAGERLAKCKIEIDDTPGISVPRIHRRSRQIKRKLGGLDAVIIDYLQLLSPHEKGRTRENDVSAMSRGLKLMAKEMNVPVICLAQLNREVEKRENKRPQLSDMRESGAVEQDADLVGFLYRQEYYDKRSGKGVKPEIQGMAEFIISKQRSGPIGTIHLTFNERTTSFGDYVDPSLVARKGGD